jgi:hypothetical protein
VNEQRLGQHAVTNRATGAAAFKGKRWITLHCAIICRRDDYGSPTDLW